MKKISGIIILILLFLSLAVIIPVNAAGLGDAFSANTIGAAANGYDTNTDIYQIIGTVISTALSLLGVIFIVLIIYGGIMWMTSEGDEGRVEKAQKIIREAVVGLIIVLAAYAISYFIINALTKLK
jgi:amino acid transporter